MSGGLLAGVLAAALMLRLVYLWQALGTPLFDVLLIDSAFYDRQAQELAAGAWLGDQVFFMNPFYSYFLAVLYALFGHYLWVPVLVQIAMGTGLCAMLYALGKHWWGERTGLVAALLGAGYGPFLFYDNALLTATPILFFNGAALCLLVAWERGGSRGLLWGTGIALGLSATARPLVLLFAALLVPWLHPRGGPGAWTRVWAGILLVLLPVAGRNYLVGGEFVLTTSAAGMNFYVGNHPGARGIYDLVDFLDSAEPEREGPVFQEEASRRAGRPLSPGEASRFWLGEGLRFAVEEPGEYLGLQLRKLYLFWHRVEAQNNLSYYFARDWVPLLAAWPFDWGVLAPLGLLSWIGFWRHQRVALLDLYLLSYLGGCLAFFVSSEYRLPVAPLLILQGARGLVWGAERARQGAWRQLAPALLLLPVAWVLNYPVELARKLTLKRVDYYNFGALYERRGERDMAERMFATALRIDPQYMLARQGLERLGRGNGEGERLAALGLQHYNRGEYAQAAQIFARALALGGARAEVYNNLGLCHYKLEEYAQAEAAFAAAIEADRHYGKAHFNLALVHLARGAEGPAEEALVRALELAPDHAGSRYRLGLLYARQERRTEALRHLEILLQRFPEDARLRALVDSLGAGP